MSPEQELREGMDYVRACLNDMHTRSTGSLSDDEQRSWDEGMSYLADGERTLARYAQAAELAERPAYRDTLSTGSDRGVPGGTRNDPFEALTSTRSMSTRQAQQTLVDANLRAIEGKIEDNANQAHFEKILKRHTNDPKGGVRWAHNILARQTDEYASAFSKLMTGRGEFLTPEERATGMDVGTSADGGYLVPTHLDPTVILTNSGTSNAIRGISRVVTLTEGSVWNGVTSAGVTAAWTGELVTATDLNPQFGRASITAYKAMGFIGASYEAFEDILGLTSDVLMMFSDARDRLEGVAHATGTGSAQPFGIFATLGAGQKITSATAAAIALADINSVYTGVPVRWRGRSQWLMNPLYSTAIKALGTAVSASFSGDLREPPTGRILGLNVVESDDAPTTQTTTALDPELILGDFSNFVIVDKPGGFSVEFIPQLFDSSGATTLPSGRRGWVAHWRTGSDSVNDAAFRLLQDKTSA